ncbi:unnamed protein product, partial [Rotaria socialis]
ESHFNAIETALCHIYVVGLLSVSTTIRHDRGGSYRSAQNS